MGSHRVGPPREGLGLRGGRGGEGGVGPRIVQPKMEKLYTVSKNKTRS